MTKPNPETYRRAINEGGWVDRSGRSRLEVTGPDRAKFLHNLVTSDVKRLPEASGVEGFVTSPQGKTLAYVTMLTTDRSILIRTEAESLEGMLPHLRKYGVFDDVEIADVSASTFEYHLTGPLVLPRLGFVSPDGHHLGHAPAMMGDVEMRVVREAVTGRPGVTLIGPIESAESIRGFFGSLGVTEIDPATFEALRIEAGTPASGRDVLPSNLPQEVGRDTLAINFVKGCYLGQETVARLDALGHVNKILKGLRIEGEAIPPPGASVMSEGKAVGSVTSSGWSPGWGAPVALAYVRVAQAGAGTVLDLEYEGGAGRAVVADLPMLSPDAP